VQLRLSGKACIEHSSAIADTAWAATNPSSRRCYLGAAPSQPSALPTSGLIADLEGRVPHIDETAPGRANFAVVLAQLDRLEWLYLAHDGHRRAAFLRDTSGVWIGQWLTP
jgi:pyridoxamine 5'-phosphate oxidase